jgi:hypothetical protein
LSSEGRANSFGMPSVEILCKYWILATNGYR